MCKLSRNQIERIRSNPNDVSWYPLGFTYDLSENFIREFKDYLYWHLISYHQRLSEAFLIEFIEDISTEHLRHNRKISQEVKERIISMKALL
jgi:hypothetical protein